MDEDLDVIEEKKDIVETANSFFAAVLSNIEIVNDPDDPDRYYPLIYSAYSELLINASEIEVFPMPQGTPGVIKFASSIHKAIGLMLTVENMDRERQEIPVVVKMLPAEQAKREAMVYKKLGNEAGLKLIAIISGDEMEKPYLHVTEARNMVISVEDRLAALVGEICTNTQGIGYLIEEAESITKSALQSLKDFHGFDLIHGDAAPKNILFDLITKKTFCIDFDLSKDSTDMSETEKINQRSLELRSFKQRCVAIIEQAFKNFINNQGLDKNEYKEKIIKLISKIEDLG